MWPHGREMWNVRNVLRDFFLQIFDSGGQRSNLKLLEHATSRKP